MFDGLLLKQGVTERQIRDAFHRVKSENGIPGNPNIEFDDDGELSLDGEPLGNIRDYVEERPDGRDRRGGGNRNRW